MDLITTITILGSSLAIIATMVSLFLWLRSESNADRRHFTEIQREDRKDLLQISRNIENMVLAIQQEMKDFHGRLCAIEERNKGK